MTFLLTLAGEDASGQEQAKAAVPLLHVSGDWQVTVAPGRRKVGRHTVNIAQETPLRVDPSTLLRIRDEKYDSLPPFNPGAAPWAKGARLRQLDTFETTAADMLVPETLVVKSGAGQVPLYIKGKDFDADLRWATFGRLNGTIPAQGPVWVDYDCGWGRIDSIAVNGGGDVLCIAGTPHKATPLPPVPPAGFITVANLWIPGRLARLTEENLYPILEPSYPEFPKQKIPEAARLLPKSWAKLKDGQPLHILAWGDSVTEGGQASDPAHQYQSVFVQMLKQQFTRSDIRLTTAAWGGRTSDSFLAEPPGSKHNFEAAVIQPHPDLIIMEFVNDAFMNPGLVEQRYTALLSRFQKIGAEWIILTPHFVRPDWMAAPSVRVETDPRPYVAGVRAFAAKHNVALADASLRWGHLLKEGIPYTTLLSNSINHPDDRGHRMFALALMELFR